MIKAVQLFTDKLAISLSMLCAIHCLILPFIILSLPNINLLRIIGQESFHLWMLFIVIPTSICALALGCKRHNRFYLMFYGGVGLSLMLIAVFLAEPFLGESWEKILTLVGASIIAIGHYKNYRLCQKDDCFDCRAE